MTSAEQARFRIDPPNSPPRVSRIIALDRRGQEALAALKDRSWNGARFLHCMPLRRNVIAQDAVVDAPYSVVIQQAGNRLHAQKALLLRLTGRR